MLLTVSKQTSAEERSNEKFPFLSFRFVQNEIILYIFEAEGGGIRLSSDGKFPQFWAIFGGCQITKKIITDWLSSENGKDSKVWREVLEKYKTARLAKDVVRGFLNHELNKKPQA